MATTRAKRIALCEARTTHPHTLDVSKRHKPTQKAISSTDTGKGINQMGSLEDLTVRDIIAFAIQLSDDAFPANLEDLMKPCTAQDFSCRDLGMSVLLVNHKFCALALMCLEEEIKR